MTQTNNNDKALWRAFIDGYLKPGEIKQQDIADPTQTFPMLSGECRKTDMAQLGQFLTPHGLKRLSARFRKFKQRSRSHQTFITIEQGTLTKLKRFAEHAGLHEDSYDLVLEYLLSPDEDVQAAKLQIQNMPTALSLKELPKLIKRRTEQQGNLITFIKLQQEVAYKAGWNDCKTQPAKKRENADMQSAMEEFMQTWES